jgi:hypothetical protein
MYAVGGQSVGQSAVYPKVHALPSWSVESGALDAEAVEKSP